MTNNIHFDRPSFDEIKTAIRRAYPAGNNDDFSLTPDSLESYFRKVGLLRRQRIADWEAYEYGRREISKEQFMALLFSDHQPQSNDNILIVTDECFREQRGFRVRFSDLTVFAHSEYPKLWRAPVHFFQPLDMIFFAEQSKMLILLHHEGWVTRHVG